MVFAPTARLAVVAVLILAPAAGCDSARTPSSAEDAPEHSADEITGVVLANDQGVAGATVRVQASSTFAKTDKHGRFRLPGANAGNRVTAWKEGFFIAGAAIQANPVEIHLERLPAKDNASYQWVDPAPDPTEAHRCANCHAEIYQQWSGGAHARSVSNRHFLNLYDGSDWQGNHGRGWNFLADYPGGAAVCTACHAPSVAVDDPAQHDLRQAQGVDAQGVHCDFCHKVQQAGGGEIGLTHGRFGMKLLRPSTGQLFFGPLDDVDRGEDAYAPVYQQSRYCASCHEGVVFGVHVYSTYSEWLASDARQQGKQCQSCHMAPNGSMTNAAPQMGGLQRDPQTLASHTLLPGGREKMLRRAVQLDAQLSALPDSYQLDIEVLAGNVGHRVPTGFIDRHLILLVEGFSRDGASIMPTEGPTLGQVGDESLRGKAGRLYAKLLCGSNGQIPAPFWREHDALDDTRLVAGRADTSRYTFGPELDSVRVRIIYRRFWRDVAREKSWPDDTITVRDTTLAVDH